MRFGLLIFVAALLRLWDLAARPLGADELLTRHVLKQMQDLGTFWPHLQYADPPLYFALHFPLLSWMELTPWSLRGLSAFCGVIAVALGYQVLRLFISSHQAYWASWVAALSPFLLYHSRSARPYMLLYLLGLCLMWLYFRKPIGNHWRYWRVGFSVILLNLMVATHYSAVIGLTGFYAITGWQHWKRQEPQRLLENMAIVGMSLLVFSPALFWLAAQQSSLSSVPLVLQVVELEPVNVLVNQFVFFGHVAPTFEGMEVLRWKFFALYLSLGLPLLFGFWQGWQNPEKQPFGSLLHWCWLPIVISFLLELALERQLLYFSRTYMMSLPILLWVSVWSTQTLWRFWLARLYLVGWWGLFGLSSVLIVFGHHPSEENMAQFTEVMEEVQKHEKVGDQILIHHWMTIRSYQYAYSGNNRVQPVGLLERPIHEDLQALDPQRRVILIENDLSPMENDPQQQVFQFLQKERDIVRQWSCRHDEIDMQCSQVTIFAKAISSEVHKEIDHDRPEALEDP